MSVRAPDASRALEIWGRVAIRSPQGTFHLEGAGDRILVEFAGFPGLPRGLARLWQLASLGVWAWRHRVWLGTADRLLERAGVRGEITLTKRVSARLGYGIRPKRSLPKLVRTSPGSTSHDEGADS